MSTVERWWQNVLAFAIVAQATRDDFEEYFTGVSHEGDATIIATLSPIFLLVKLYTYPRPSAVYFVRGLLCQIMLLFCALIPGIGVPLSLKV